MVLGNNKMTRSPAENWKGAVSACPGSGRPPERSGCARMLPTIRSDPASLRQNRPFDLTQTKPRSGPEFPSATGGVGELARAARHTDTAIDLLR